MTTLYPFSGLTQAQQERARASFLDARPGDGYHYVLDSDGVVLARTRKHRECSGVTMRLEPSVNRDAGSPVQRAQTLLRQWSGQMDESARRRTLALADRLSEVDENAARYLYLRNNDDWPEDVCEAFSDTGNGEHKDLVIDKARGKVRDMRGLR